MNTWPRRQRGVLLVWWMMALLALMSRGVLAETGNQFRLGGALRFNYGWLDYGPSSKFQPELVRLDASGQYGNVFADAQYRWYDGFDAVHHAFVGWKFAENTDLRAGVVQVPFGMLPYAAQGFWFNTDYYLGLDEDYDLGIVWQQKNGHHHWHAGIFFGDEYGDGARYGRYSFDIANTPARPYREHGQVNLRYEYSGQLGAYAMKTGISARRGRLEEKSAGRHHPHTATAAHIDLKRGNLATQLQWIYYQYDVPGNRVALSAFLYPFDIAAKAHMPSVNLIYDLPRKGWFDAITCYNNHSTNLTSGAGLRNSQQNVTGCMLGKGKTLTYIDWIAGRNMWFSGGPGIGIHEPGQGGWHSRLNINIAYYF